MPSVAFVYDKDCPNVTAARANLVRAFSRVGLTARWQEHVIGTEDAPQHVRGYGSPTILVDGVDVAGLSPGSERCCRVYGRTGAPDVELIADALARACRSDTAADEQPPVLCPVDGSPRPLWSAGSDRADTE